MNHMTFLFLLGLFSGLVSQAIQSETFHRFETVDSLLDQYIEETSINDSFIGHQWLESRVTSDIVDLNQMYQKNIGHKELEDNSEVNRVKKSYYTYIEERICPNSPYIDKPVRAPITSRYGRRVHPLSGRSHVHAGIDFRGRTGTPVVAAAQGLAKSVKRKGNYGKTIVIDHGNSYTTLYGHLSDYAIKEGQWVNLGQTIGYIGRTGRATGPHLHFEVRCYNVPLNPRQYLGKSGKVAEVRFRKRSRHNFAAPSRGLAVKRDPNYYTRMINLKKLESLRLNAKKF